MAYVSWWTDPCVHQILQRLIRVLHHRKRWANAGSTVGQRLRRWPTVEPAGPLFIFLHNNFTDPASAGVEENRHSDECRPMVNRDLSGRHIHIQYTLTQ